jgi:hypothetical protein
MTRHGTRGKLPTASATVLVELPRAERAAGPPCRSHRSCACACAFLPFVVRSCAVPGQGRPSPVPTSVLLHSTLIQHVSKESHSALRVDNLFFFPNALSLLPLQPLPYPIVKYNVSKKIF